jgi:hypothetical protein
MPMCRKFRSEAKTPELGVGRFRSGSLALAWPLA